MKQTIEIEVPDGKKAVWKDGKVIFENIKPKLPETWEEFCYNYKIQEEECYINTDAEIKRAVSSRNRLIYGDSNVLPNKQAAEAHLALIKLHQLRDCYRQGWIPDWKNSKSSKYCIEYINDRCDITAYRTASKFLSFQSREIAQKFLTNFRWLIKQVGDLI